MSTFVSSLWRRHVTAHLDAIDAECTSPPAITSMGCNAMPARSKSIWVFVVGALVLTGMSYITLQHGVQQQMAEVLISAASGVSVELGALARKYDDLLRMGDRKSVV